jgi:glycosyltransferase involved in cell wall biosynthesis
MTQHGDSQVARGVSILVSTNLGPNLIRGKVLPLVELPEVREVIVVQDAAGPPMPKVRYVRLGPPLCGRLAHAFLRVVVLCLQIALRRPSLVMGIYMMPHGLLAYVLGRLARRYVCLHVIGGPGEIIDGGYWLDQWPVRRPNKRLEKLYLEVLRRADVVVVVGSETKRYLASAGVADDRIHLMSSKIDPHRFHPVRAARCDYDLILTAQLIARKRVDLFLRIVADLRRRHPDVRAAILGEGALRGDLERLADTLGIGDRVDFLGFHEDTERFYTRARVFVLTSTAEGLSLAMLEAMACGVPAVVPAIGDLADVVCEGVTGYLVEGGDQAAFVTRLSDLLEHEERRRWLGDNARSVILRGYTVEDGARSWHAILDHLQPLARLPLLRHHI